MIQYCCPQWFVSKRKCLLHLVFEHLQPFNSTQFDVLHTDTNCFSFSQFRVLIHFRKLRSRFLIVYRLLCQMLLLVLLLIWFFQLYSSSDIQWPIKKLEKKLTVSCDISPFSNFIELLLLLSSPLSYSQLHIHSFIYSLSFLFCIFFCLSLCDNKFNIENTFNSIDISYFLFLNERKKRIAHRSSQRKHACKHKQTNWNLQFELFENVMYGFIIRRRCRRSCCRLRVFAKLFLHVFIHNIFTLPVKYLVP